MAYLTCDLHCHRDPMTQEEMHNILPRAAGIARTLMEAFAVPHDIELSDERCDIFMNLGTPARDLLTFPEPTGLGLSLQYIRHTGWLAGYVAATETALAWQQAGLIHHFCDLLRWNRYPGWTTMGTPDDHRQIAAGLANMGIPNGPPEHKEYPTINPDPGAARLARNLLEHLDYPRAAVLLIGSRARGDHQPASDIDLILYLDQRASHHSIERTRRRARRFLRTNTASIRRKGSRTDAYIVRHWHYPQWEHHSERLTANQPSGLAFTTDPGILRQAPISISDQPQTQGGIPFYFLTSGADVTTVHNAGWGTKDALDLMRCK